MAARLRILRDAGTTNFAMISRETGVSRTLISQYCNGNMRITPDVEEKLLRWETKHMTEQEQADAVRAACQFKTKLELFRTQEFDEALGTLAWMKEKRKMCIVIGHPGVGKTTLLREFASRNTGVRIITCRPTMRMRDMLDTIADTLRVSTSGSNDARVQQIQRELQQRTDDMLIFDEAHHLYSWDVKKFEILRQIWDETGLPTVLAGPPQLEELLTHGSGRQNLSQLYRRKFEIRLNGIRANEAKQILREYNVEPEAVEMLAAIAADVKHGGRGIFTEVFELCLDAAQGGQITKKMLEDAIEFKMRA